MCRGFAGYLSEAQLNKFKPINNKKEFNASLVVNKETHKIDFEFAKQDPTLVNIYEEILLCAYHLFKTISLHICKCLIAVTIYTVYRLPFVIQDKLKHTICYGTVIKNIKTKLFHI